MRNLFMTLTVKIAQFSFFVFFLCNSMHAQIIQNCNITLDAGPDQQICTTGSTVSLNASVTGDFLFSQWSPSNLVTDSTALSTTAVVDSTQLFTFTVFSVSDNNLILNGDFESGSTGFTSDYMDNTGGGVGAINSEGTFGVDDSPRDLHRRFANCDDHTSGNGNMMVVNGSGAANNVWCQTVTVNPSTNYIFTAWASSATDENPAQLQFSINQQLIGEVFNATSSTCNWEQFFCSMGF